MGHLSGGNSQRFAMSNYRLLIVLHFEMVNMPELNKTFQQTLEKHSNAQYLACANFCPTIYTQSKNLVENERMRVSATQLRDTTNNNCKVCIMMLLATFDCEQKKKINERKKNKRSPQ